VTLDVNGIAVSRTLSPVAVHVADEAKNVALPDNALVVSTVPVAVDASVICVLRTLGAVTVAVTVPIKEICVVSADAVVTVPLAAETS
jgi:hypothetical protein